MLPGGERYDGVVAPSDFSHKQLDVTISLISLVVS
jgi:hypothetical protein